ncbi:MAG: hypothetical protein K2J85_01985, partial [Anaeroplasmataceae bacterium]|nr:hypothetical protein [Anaeroplasmataceae bacterium]
NMYFQANDNELIYLIKDGNANAQRILYSKYEHLIWKIFQKNGKTKGLVYEDFKQECLMCLEQAIYSYQESFKCSFYSYFLVLVSRNTSKLLRKNGLLLKENETIYSPLDCFQSPPMYSKLIHLVNQKYKFSDDLEKDLFYECILKNVKVVEVARKYNMDYRSVYTKYQKIKQKVEKLLTNSLV